MERQPNTEYILSLSYGKDSIACLEAIRQLGWPLDRIVHAEVWATCLWLKGLKPLEFEVKHQPRVIEYKNGKGTDSPWHMNTMGLQKEERAKQRSKTFPGIARAMAEQWAGICEI